MRACVGQWYSAGLELKIIAQANRFPSGFPGSIPGAGVNSGIEAHDSSDDASVIPTLASCSIPDAGVFSRFILFKKLVWL